MLAPVEPPWVMDNPSLSQRSPKFKLYDGVTTVECSGLKPQVLLGASEPAPILYVPVYEPESRLKLYPTPSVPAPPPVSVSLWKRYTYPNCEGASGSVALTTSRVVTSTPVGSATELPTCWPVSAARKDSSSFPSNIGFESGGV